MNFSSVDPKEAPDYEEVVKKPMDFSKIRKRLETNLQNWEWTRT